MSWGNVRTGLVTMTNTIDSSHAATLMSAQGIAAEIRQEAGQRKRSTRWVPYASAMVDVTTASLAVAVGMTWANETNQLLPPSWMVCFFAPTVVAVSALGGRYRRKVNRSFLEELPTIEAVTALAAMLLLSGLVLNTGITGSRSGAVARVWMCGAILIPVGRLLWIEWKRYSFRRDRLTAPTLIVGNGQIAEKVLERITGSTAYGLRAVGIVDDEVPSMGPDRKSPAAVPYLGKLADIEQAITRTGAECIIVAFSRTRDEALADVVRIAYKHSMNVWIVPRIFDAIGVHSRIDHVGGLPLISVPRTDPRGWEFRAKHISDRVFATAGLVLISPLFLTLMLLVRLSSPGPIFYGQDRIGRDGGVFCCRKFRSMRPLRECDARFTLSDGTAPGGVEGEDRRTPIGKFMRATSLDELPQLLNVIRGEMSLVGPRPERPEYVDLFNAQIVRYGDRHRVKAGITGWAQVHGLRGQTSIADRAEWDNFYIENWSIWLDWRILAMTVLAVLRRAE